MSLPNENELNQSDRKRQAILEAAASLIKELLAEDYAALCDSACEEFARTEGQGQPEVKVKFSIKWNPMPFAPKVEADISWSSAHKASAEIELDPDQLRLPEIDEASQPVKFNARAAK